MQGGFDTQYRLLDEDLLKSFLRLFLPTALINKSGLTAQEQGVINSCLNLRDAILESFKEGDFSWGEKVRQSFGAQAALATLIQPRAVHKYFVS